MVYIKKFNRIAYILLSVLVGIFLLVAVCASFAGDNSLFTGDGESILSQWVPLILFSVYALIQVGCLALYRFGFGVYKIGFVLLHVGILVMLVGFLAGALGGEQSYFNLTTGSYYDGYYDSTGNYNSLGFGIQITDFTVEKYESGSDKHYHADLLITDTSTGVQEEAVLEVNHTYRNKGWKIYLMSYSDGKTVGELANRQIDNSFEANGWTELAEKIAAVYPVDAETSYLCYNLNSGTYRETTTDALTVSATMPLYGHVVVENGKLTIYVYPEQELLLFKQDPGEYAVLVGMIMIFVGAVMTCLLPRRKNTDKDETVKTNADRDCEKSSGGKAGKS
ncbi:MAG: cytochrome c biogenesis protein ResB [Eubacteriales bacterium]